MLARAIRFYFPMEIFVGRLFILSIPLIFKKHFCWAQFLSLPLARKTDIAEGGHFGTYNYMNLVTTLPKLKSKIITDIYYGADSFLGPEDRTLLVDGKALYGFQIGLEQPIIEEKLLFIAENISGQHNLGETTVGAAYYLAPRWIFSIGFQFSNPGSKTPEALVIEFSFVPALRKVRY